MIFLQWLSTDASNHIVSLTKVAAYRNKFCIRPSEWAMALFFLELCLNSQGASRQGNKIVSDRTVVCTSTWIRQTGLHFLAETCREAQDSAFEKNLCGRTLFWTTARWKKLKPWYHRRYTAVPRSRCLVLLVSRHKELTWIALWPDPSTKLFGVCDLRICQRARVGQLNDDLTGIVCPYLGPCGAKSRWLGLSGYFS